MQLPGYLDNMVVFLDRKGYVVGIISLPRQDILNTMFVMVDHNVESNFWWLEDLAFFFYMESNLLTPAPSLTSPTLRSPPLS